MNVPTNVTQLLKLLKEANYDGFNHQLAQETGLPYQDYTSTEGGLSLPFPEGYHYSVSVRMEEGGFRVHSRLSPIDKPDDCVRFWIHKPTLGEALAAGYTGVLLRFWLKGNS